MILSMELSTFVDFEKTFDFGTKLRFYEFLFADSKNRGKHEELLKRVEKLNEYLL